jgi:hypothetical protein
VHSTNLTEQANMLCIDAVRPPNPITIAAAMNTKRITQCFKGIALVELLN